jgi:hypothetical protein
LQTQDAGTTGAPCNVDQDCATLSYCDATGSPGSCEPVCDLAKCTAGSACCPTGTACQNAFSISGAIVGFCQ